MHGSRTTSWGKAALLAMAAGLASPPAATAQPAAGADAAAPDAFPREADATREQACWRLARFSLLWLRGLESPTPRDYRITALLLAQASAMNPKNEEVLRRSIDAWHNAGDAERTLAATAALVRLNPSDTVAQLRLISSRLSRLQEIEARLAAYDRLLGEGGKSLDPSVRSRLALDAALLVRERGDDRGFAERLTQATQLDSTNKQAAVLAAAFYNSRSDDPMGRIEMLVNVLLADPLDAAAHRDVGREFARHGAFRAALRFTGYGDRLSNAAGVRLPTSSLTESLVMLWQRDGNEAVMKEIGQFEQALRGSRESSATSGASAGKAAGRPLEKVHLPTEVETIRLALNLAAGRREAAEASMRSVVSELEEVVADADRPGPEGVAPVSPEDREVREKNARVGGLWARLWAGAEIDKAEAALAEIREKHDLDADALRRFDGWLALRQGRFADAEAALLPIADEDLQAGLGVATMWESRGELAKAIAAYARLALERPESVLGAYGRRWIETLRDEPLAPTETATKLEAYAEALPPWLESAVTEFKASLFVAAEHPRKAMPPGDPVELKITVQNIGRAPVSIGPDSALSSRVLITPTIKVQGRGTPPEARVKQEIADIGQRLRLLPSERFEATVWAGQGVFGDAVDAVLPPMTVRLRATTNFVVTPDGRFTAGPQSATADTGIASRGPLQSIALKAEEGGAYIANAQGEGLARAVLYVHGLASLVLSPEKDEALTGAVAPLEEALAARLPSMTELERVLTLAVLTSGVNKAAARPVLGAAAADPSPLVRAVRLIAEPPPATDASYTFVIENGPPDVSELGRLLRDAAAEREAAPAARPAAAEPVK